MGRSSIVAIINSDCETLNRDTSIESYFNKNYMSDMMRGVYHLTEHYGSNYNFIDREEGWSWHWSWVNILKVKRKL